MVHLGARRSSAEAAAVAVAAAGAAVGAVDACAGDGAHAHALRRSGRRSGLGWVGISLAAAVTPVVLQPAGLHGPGERHEEQLIGWQGETYKPKGVMASAQTRKYGMHACTHA
eukprot:349801-Chlamydomonas_euryale.AAC.68